MDIKHSLANPRAALPDAVPLFIIKTLLVCQAKQFQAPQAAQTDQQPANKEETG
ncbi:MAG TPA: hypothetical protein PKD86_18620 [Gemmatales bacterium]|nr:hypothetical protein [Gemmatales bacterium]HMP61359.1 hypothetical protein [Gemmatales bacterium]